VRSFGENIEKNMVSGLDRLQIHQVVTAMITVFERRFISLRRIFRIGRWP